MNLSFKISRQKFLLFIDSLIILLNISLTYTIIPYVLFSNSLTFNSIIIASITILYGLYRFGVKVKFPVRHTLFLLYILINLINFIFGLYTNTGVFGYFIGFIVHTIFYLFLYNAYRFYQEKNTQEDANVLIQRGYLWMCFLALFSAILLLVLINIFGINPLRNPVGHLYNLFTDNITRFLGTEYYFPYRTGILLTNTGGALRLPFIHKFGIITGLFHEPHTMTFVVIPSFFLLWSKIKTLTQKVLLIVIFAIYMLQAASTTNILVFTFCLLVWMYLNNKKTTIAIVTLLFISALYFISFNEGFINYITLGLQLSDPDNQLANLIISKIGSSSATYSQSVIDFAFTPNRIAGTCFNNFGYLYDKGGYIDYNVGYIVFAINIIFLLLFTYKIVRLFFSKNRDSVFVGLFALYFFMHSTKLAMRTYSLSLLLFVIFIVSITYESRVSKQNYNKKIVV